MELSKHGRLLVGLKSKTGSDISREFAVMAVSYTLGAEDISGFSVTDVLGYWKGNRERSLSFEVYCDPATALKATELAQSIAITLRQEAVLVEVRDASARLVSPDF
jgi:hypothetical protein